MMVNPVPTHVPASRLIHWGILGMIFHLKPGQQQSEARWPEKGEGHLSGADLVALKLGQPVLVIQCTSGSSHVARRC